MGNQLLVAGGGIAGLAAAVAARRAGWHAIVFEQASEFNEVGAGIQLGPNSTRILREWGLLEGELSQRLARPTRLRVRDAVDGAELGTLALKDFEARYGAPYCTVHRADIHSALLRAAREREAVLHTGRRIDAVEDLENHVRLMFEHGPAVEGDALAAADGVWSTIRTLLLADAPRPTGHLAYRTLLRQSELPAAMRTNEVTAWLAPRLHLVAYPVRAGEWLNLVCIVEGTVAGDARGWDHAGGLRDLYAAAGRVCQPARDLIEAGPHWRLWTLHDRPPVASHSEMAQGHVALLGDAAHPMPPYLAQGAGMALEDARELERVLPVADGRTLDVPTALRRYALSRWERCARVQARSQRNGRIFHADGLMRAGRNLSLRVLGERILDLPWLYGY